MKSLAQGLFFVLIVLVAACTPSEEQMETWKKEIVDTEAAFAAMAEEEGIASAFLAFAADDAVLMRNNTLIIGKEALKQSLEATAGLNASLSWSPDFVDVSRSGDLAYTYGKFVYTLVDSLGKEEVQEGVFHTVWKRQEDGSWKFVWD